MNNIVALIVAVAMLVASGMQMYSSIKIQAVLQMDPELERLAIAYYRDQQERRAEIRKIDAANKAAEQNFKLNLPSVSENAKAFDKALRDAVKPE
jgi:hypothetical protein